MENGTVFKESRICRVFGEACRARSKFRRAAFGNVILAYPAKSVPDFEILRIIRITNFWFHVFEKILFLRIESTLSLELHRQLGLV